MLALHYTSTLACKGGLGFPPPPSPHQGDRVGVNTGGEKDDTRKRKMRAKVDLAKKKKVGTRRRDGNGHVIKADMKGG